MRWGLVLGAPADGEGRSAGRPFATLGGGIYTQRGAVVGFELVSYCVRFYEWSA